MSEYYKKTIEVCSELIIEIHHNPNLVNRPYLCRFFTYEGFLDARLDSKELLKLSECLADCLFDKPQNDDMMDIWHQNTD